MVLERDVTHLLLTPARRRTAVVAAHLTDIAA
jgi:hypothetical protein